MRKLRDIIRRVLGRGPKPDEPKQPKQRGSKPTMTGRLYIKQGNKYLHHLAYPAQPEKDKWTTDKHYADLFISDVTANNVAKRKLGHSNYTVVRE